MGKRYSREVKEEVLAKIRSGQKSLGGCTDPRDE